MHISLYSMFTALFIPLLLFSLILILTTRAHKDREKLSPFECGFDPSRSARLPFSTRFFLLAVIFLVFDIEIVILLPTPAMMSLNTPLLAIWGLLPFLLILFIGLLHEWHEGSLNWNPSLTL